MRRWALRLSGRDSPVGTNESSNGNVVKEPREDEERVKAPKFDFRRSTSTAGDFSPRSWISDKVLPPQPVVAKNNTSNSRLRSNTNTSGGDTLSNFDACIHVCGSRSRIIVYSLYN